MGQLGSFLGQEIQSIHHCTPSLSMAVSAQNPLSSKYICNFSFILYYLYKNTKVMLKVKEGFPGGPDSKEFACNAGDLGSIPGSGRSPTEGNGNLIQYFCLENFMDRGVWQAIVHGSQRLDTTE